MRRYCYSGGTEADELAMAQYDDIITHVFFQDFQEGAETVPFSREELVEAATHLGLQRPRNIGDIPYSFRYRRDLPKSITDAAPAGCEWVIRGAGVGLYRFDAVPMLDLRPNTSMATTKIPDATPGIISRYAQSDEQALLAVIRYNRLIDTFVGVTCYSLQNHLSTSIPEIGAVETDEVYVGVDKRGVHYVFPVEAKGARDRLGRVQIEQDFALCEAKFPNLVCRPIGAQFMQDKVIVLFEFEKEGDNLAIVSERHYQLVPIDEISDDDLARYLSRPSL